MCDIGEITHERILEPLDEPAELDVPAAQPVPQLVPQPA